MVAIDNPLDNKFSEMSCLRKSLAEWNAFIILFVKNLKNLIENTKNLNLAGSPSIQFVNQLAKVFMKLGWNYKSQ